MGICSLISIFSESMTIKAKPLIFIKELNQNEPKQEFFNRGN